MVDHGSTLMGFKVGFHRFFLRFCFVSPTVTAFCHWLEVRWTPPPCHSGIMAIHEGFNIITSIPYVISTGPPKLKVSRHMGRQPFWGLGVYGFRV